ncbi:NAD(P)-dependent dehydrogenase (short-subunit alcohol dehydrogenase family) [Rhizobium sp. BK275]|uniref:SDR family oxidoreductase n=1 Tax=Rhizobium sp. BK275 TaxID=2587077 RepID=UPI00161711D4|nr:SDR family oxidoreductase [Rhizobium sp. BK275]MBB3388881.1 NAD(P)-dependent dehydrogenase (short-subunit alcohol dehydrogenase family) [Rhizobium sp. BK275]
MKKTVLITGASSGIGKAAGRLFHANGWNVIATMRSPEKESELTELADILVVRLDVQDRGSIDTAIKAGIEQFGRIDVLVNNAGYGQNGIFEATSREKIQQQFDVNVFGVMDVTRAILPHFRANKAGTIINVSSGAGLFTLPTLSIYCASKFALEGFTEALSYELLGLGVGVKSVIPHGGVAETSFQERAGADFAIDPSGLPDYNEFLQRAQRAFAAMVAAKMMTSSDVARVVYEAATDGKDQLRYLVGDDARGFVKARRSMDDQAYMDFMRAQFVE